MKRYASANLKTVRNRGYPTDSPNKIVSMIFDRNFGILIAHDSQPTSSICPNLGLNAVPIRTSKPRLRATLAVLI